jgi:hypothetical protein
MDASIIRIQVPSMTSFTIGEKVRKAKGGTGVIRAIFTTVDGGRRYAVEDEGVVDFVDEGSLARATQARLTAA